MAGERRTHDAGCALVRLECLPDGEHWMNFEQDECMECGAECSCGTPS